MIRALATRPVARSISLLFVAGLIGAGAADAQQTIGTCSVLPANNIWNTPVDALPVLSNSAAMVATIGANTGFHADFGAGTWNGGPIGIPFITVSATQTKYPATFLYADESDAGPYAIPLNAPIEGGSQSSGDRHAIAVDTGNCILYELFSAFPQSSSWSADSGAIVDLRSNALRPSTWTSADAAGLPIVPGLVTYEEVLSGEIKHAIRFTASRTRREFVWPARHYASSLTGTQYPRMGERFRLKASFNISPYPADVQVILRAMKKYGIMLADNGSNWFVSGKPDERWNNDNLQTLRQLLGSNFEAVDAILLRIDPNSGAAIQGGVTVTVSPSSASVRTGRPKMFTATVTGAPNTVTWSVNGIAGGDVVVGAIDANGQYLAPSAVPSPPTVTVRAASTTSPTSTGTSSITILSLPNISSVSPSPLVIGNFTLTVNGAGFVAGSLVSFDGAVLASSFVSSTRLTATGNAPIAKPSVPVIVNTPDGERSNTFYVDVTAPPATIALSATSVAAGATVTATIANGPGHSLDWVGLFAAGAPPASYLRAAYLTGTLTPPAPGLTGGTVTFTLPLAPGTYQVRFFLNDSYTVLAVSALITVAPPTVTLSATTVAAGGTVSATIANGPGHSLDWVGLFAAGAPSAGYLRAAYLTGTLTPPVPGLTGGTLPFTLPLTPGTYQVRFFLNDSFTLLATSLTITVP
jgi:hypothetical protein